MNENSSQTKATPWSLYVFLMCFLLVLARMTFAAPYVIPTSSMSPTLPAGTVILVNEGEYVRDGEPDRGDIITFDRPNSWVLPEEAPPILIKRVIGLPGETISCTVDHKVEINGVRIEEPYVANQEYRCSAFAPTLIPAGHYWVMGDNREDSADSSYAPPGEKFNGPVAINLIHGRQWASLFHIALFEDMLTDG